MNVFASDNFRHFSRAPHVYFCEVARNFHALRTSLSFAKWSCKMSLLVIQNPPYVGGEIRSPGYITIRVTYASSLLPDENLEYPVSVNSPSRHASEFFDVTQRAYVRQNWR